MGEYSVYGTLYVVAPEGDGEALSDAIHDRATEQTGDGRSSARAAATTLPNGAGVVVRALGHRAEDVTAALHAAWDEARRELLDVGAPDGRKL